MFRFLSRAVKVLAQASQLSEIADRCTDSDELRRAVLEIIRGGRAKKGGPAEPAAEKDGRIPLPA